MSTLNKQIVLARRTIRKAKLFTINKMVKESKKLKEKHGTDEQKQKYIKKSNRIIEEVRVVKNLNDSEVLKFLLTNQEDPEKLLSDPETELVLRVLAKVSRNDIIRKFLSEFKTNFPDWTSQSSRLLLKLDKKLKVEKIKTKNKNKRVLVSKASIKSGNANSEKKRKIKKSAGNNRFVVECIKEPDIKSIGNPNKHSKKTDNMDSFNKDKSENFNKFKSQNGISIQNVKREMSCKKKRGTEENEFKVADPFFVTADNTDYMTVVTNEKQLEAFNTPVNETFTNNDSSKKSYKYNGSSKNFSSREKDKTRGFNNKFKNRQTKGNKVMRKFEKQNFQNDTNKEVKLHPSWEAKKKIANISTTQFSGKKIVFGDD